MRDERWKQQESFKVDLHENVYQKLCYNIGAWLTSGGVGGSLSLCGLTLLVMSFTVRQLSESSDTFT